MRISNFQELEQYVKSSSFQARCIVPEAADGHVLSAVMQAARERIVEPILVGDREKILTLLEELSLDEIPCRIVDECGGEAVSAQVAVDIVNAGEADYIMKGLMNTSTLMRTVFKRTNNLRTDRIATSVSIRKIEKYHKLLAFTDAGICINPTFDQKKMIVENGLDLLRRVGVDCPKVAVLAAVEKRNEDMPETVDADELKKLAQQGAFGDCLLEGPISFDLAFSKEAAETKKYDSPVAGDADLLVFPNVVSGNMTVKAIDLAAESTGAGVIVGAKIPLVFSSRSASTEYKYNSILLASAYCHSKG